MRDTETEHVTDGGLPESTLQDVLTARSLFSLEQTVQLGIGIIDDMIHLENRGVYCRELTPNDILFEGTDQRPRVRAMPTQEKSGIRPREAGEGLSCYTSPEVARGDTPDSRSNVWLVGVLLFEMLTGKPPFCAHESANAHGELPSETALNVREFRNDVPDALASMIYQMLDTDRDLRLQSIDLAKVGLERFRRDLFSQPPICERNDQLRSIAYTSTRFVGREEEIARIAALLADGNSRLLSLVGPGGVGKSCLAFHAAERQAAQFSDGVYFVPLTPVTSPAFIALAIANTLRFSFSGRREPVQQVIDYLKTKQLLLVLDNFDHLLKGSELIAQLLAETKEVRIIVTSRERLNLHQERLLEVVGLAVPPHDHVDDAENYGAVQLFVDNAQRVHSRFTLNDAEKPHVIHLCQMLEGLPLGIVLASGWTRVLTCKEIAHEIERGIDFLATAEDDVPEQHRSMRAALDRSWWLLSGQERAVLLRMSVFQGGFSRTAAERIAETSVHTLAALVDKSLVQRDAFGRYQIHELLRQYLVEKLENTPDELARVREAHSSFYATFLDARRARLRGEEQKSALEEIERELANVQRGWEWAVEHVRVGDIDKYLGPLASLYDARGWLQEAEELFGKAATAIREATGSRADIDVELQHALGRLLARQGESHCRLARYETARTLVTEGLEFLRIAGAQEDIAFVLTSLANIARCEGNYDEARQLCEESLGISEANLDRFAEARAWDGLGVIAMQLGNYDDARAHHEEALAISRKTGDLRGIARCLNSLGNIAHNAGDPHEARKRYQEGLLIFREFEDRAGVCASLHNLGMVAVMLGEYTRAKEFLRESLAIGRYIGDEYVVAHGLYTVGETCSELGENEEAKDALEESLAICRRIGNKAAEAHCLTTLGTVLQTLGDERGAEHAHGASLTITRELGLRRPEAASLLGLGEVAAAIGDHERADSLRGQALQIAAKIKAVPLALAILSRWADAFKRRGETERAVELYAFVADHESSKQSAVVRCGEMLDDLASCLSAEEFEGAVARGKGQMFEEIVKELLRDSSLTQSEA